MALSALGAVTGTHTATDDPVDLALTSAVAAGTVIVVPFGGDSNSISLSSVSDSEGNSWDSAYRSTSQGNSGIAWCQVSNPLTTSDYIRLNFSSANDTTARAYAFTGIGGAELVDGTRTYTESSTFSLSLTSGSSGVMFVTFQFPYDYFTTTISGWTRFAAIQDGTDQQLLAYYKEISSGSNTCSKTIGATVGYLAAGVVLPLGASTTTTPAPTVAMGSQILSLF